MWHIIGEQLEGGLRDGEATWSDDQLLPAHRFGYQEAYFTYSYSPIPDEDQCVLGRVHRAHRDHDTQQDVHPVQVQAVAVLAHTIHREPTR